MRLPRDAEGVHADDLVLGVERRPARHASRHRGVDLRDRDPLLGGGLRADRPRGERCRLPGHVGDPVHGARESDRRHLILHLRVLRGDGQVVGHGHVADLEDRRVAVLERLEGHHASEERVLAGERSAVGDVGLADVDGRLVDRDVPVEVLDIGLDVELLVLDDVTDERQADAVVLLETVAGGGDVRILGHEEAGAVEDRVGRVGLGGVVLERHGDRALVLDVHPNHGAVDLVDIGGGCTRGCDDHQCHDRERGQDTSCDGRIHDSSIQIGRFVLPIWD